MKSPLVLLFLILIFTSCSNDKENIDYVAQNEADITAYITANDLNAIKSDSGLYYVINDPGTGVQPTVASKVTVAFKEGGSGILLVPAHLGYGNSDFRTIPGGSVLIFDINLISVN